MKGKDLFDAMGMIDDRYVEEAAPDEKTLQKAMNGPTQTVPLKKKRKKWYQNPRFWGGLATAAAILILTAVILPQVDKIQKNGGKHYSSIPGNTKHPSGNSSYLEGDLARDEAEYGDSLKRSEEIKGTEKYGVEHETQWGREETKNPEELLGSERLGSKSAEKISLLFFEKNAVSEKGQDSFRITYVTAGGQFLRTKSSQKNIGSSFKYFSVPTYSSMDTFQVVGARDPEEVRSKTASLRDPDSYSFDPSEVKTVRPDDLDLTQIVPSDSEETLLLILEQKEDLITYVIPDPSDPRTREVLKWYHESIDESKD